MSEKINIITPDWHAPDNVIAFTTTRMGGVSAAPYNSLNLAAHVGDELIAVQHNRHALMSQFHLPNEPAWLNQVHGNTVTEATLGHQLVDADASFTQQANIVCAVLTADCLPILVCNKAGTEVAAIHAGWRSLAAGIIENTLAKLHSAPENIVVWLGPAIGANVYEVGTDVYDAFVSHDAAAVAAFQPTRPGHWLADLPALAIQRLQQLGIQAISRTELSTNQSNAALFSVRAQAQTGRIASLIYFT